MPRLPVLALVALAIAAPLAGCLGERVQDSIGSGARGGRELTILTHDSYYIGKEVIASFERATGATVRVVPAGDAGQTLNVAILNKDRPIGDLLFGVDNSLLARAVDEEVFEPYRPANASKVRADLVFDAEWRVTPVDYGYVNVNYDVAALRDAGLAPPTSLRELAEPGWRGKLVVENPATSSPGLAFLLATVAEFGEDDEYSYEDYWRDLKANGVKVAPGWSDAYFTYFSGGGYGGDRPLVVSYTTSPPYAVREACTIDGKYVGLSACPAEKKVMPTGNAPIPGGAWLQIEAMGVLRNAKNQDLARSFIEFALTKEYQESASFNMFVYPATTDAVAPDFLSLVMAPERPAAMSPTEVTPDAVKGWLDGWSNAVIG